MPDFNDIWAAVDLRSCESLHTAFLAGRMDHRSDEYLPAFRSIFCRGFWGFLVWGLS